MHLMSQSEYLLRTNTRYEHLAKKFERAVLSCFGRDGSEMAVCLRRFFVRQRFLVSENGLNELASTFCHVPTAHGILLKGRGLIQELIKLYTELLTASHHFNIYT